MVSGVHGWYLPGQFWSIQLDEGAEGFWPPKIHGAGAAKTVEESMERVMAASESSEDTMAMSGKI
jgi:hypothetical protein